MTTTLTPTAKKNAIAGKNVLVGYKLATAQQSDPWITIPGVSIYSGIGGSVEDIDQTCIAEATKRYLAGAFDGNEITITIHHYTGDTVQQTLINAANAGSVINLMVEWPDGTTGEMEVALKQAIPQDPSLSETIKWDITGKLNGMPTWTFGTV